MAQMLQLAYGGHNLVLAQNKIRTGKENAEGAGGKRKRQIMKANKLDLKSKTTRQEKADDQLLIIERIKERFWKLDLCVSSYDTAWVAMVPSNNQQQQQQPYFPGCLQWVMENQKADGSWGLNPCTHPLHLKDSLSSTLASVLALHKWRVGQQLVQKGLDFIRSNRFAVSDNNQISPMGFDIVFPGMLNYARDLGLNLPLDSAFLDGVQHRFDLEIQSGNGKGSHIGYFAEGLGEKYEWEEMIKKEQRRNGSVFNSPATTAAAFIHLQNDKCFHYLNSLVELHGNAVPTIYPYGIYVRLCIVDTLESLGIARYFTQEIDKVLDQTYRCWQQRDEEIFMDAGCCALAFRLLRMHGYDDVTSSMLGDLVDEDKSFNKANQQLNNTNTIIQLYKASQIKIFEEEPILENISIWTNTFLQQQLLKDEIRDDNLLKEVEYTLDYSINSLDRLSHRRRIELYDANRVRMLKTSYRCSNIDNKDILGFSIHDYDNCQAILHQEVDQFEKWVKESRMSVLKFDWHVLISSYFLIAAVHFSPEEAEARAAWTKASFIGTIIDDVFDIDGSREELLNIIELVDKWDDPSSVGYCSERIEILFSAVRDSVDYFVTKAYITQGRYIKQELIKIWLDFLKCMLKEVEWWKKKSTPSMEEYLTNGCETIGLGLFATAFYFLGVEFPEDAITSQQYKSLYKHAGIILRLFNDYQGLERDKVQRKMNSCWLLMEHSNGTLSEAEARAEVMRMIEKHQRELLRMVVQSEGSDENIPREIRESFFKVSKIGEYLYGKGDEYRCPGKTLADIKAVLYEPISTHPIIPKEKQDKQLASLVN